MKRTTDSNFHPAITNSDVVAVCSLIETRKGTEFFEHRRERNVIGQVPDFSRETFWRSLMACLLTSQQQSKKGSRVDSLFNTKPFPLRLDICDKQVSTKGFVRNVLREWRGIRFGPTIANRAAENLKRLNKNRWSEAEDWFERLKKQRARKPEKDDYVLEREAAHWADGFPGLGPKQSRNLWQDLGLTRYEIPVDSSVTAWINAKLSFRVDKGRLGYLPYYEAVLGHVQAICDKAGVLPQDLDAAAFDYENLGSTEPRVRTTTQAGFVNENGQVTIRNTKLPGTDHNQYVYQLACSLCGQVYGANGSDIHERKCPKCQSGKPGLAL